MNLNHAQTYETYISNDEEVTPITDGFDARLLMATTDYLDLDDTNEQVNFIQKQNPGMQFSTTFPVIYRMGSIWLRYAMALNGAGFPGYAFAILKSGLCGNTNWLPTDESDYAPASFRYYDSADSLYYESTDSLIYRVYQEAPDSIFTTITDSLSFEEFQEHIGTLHDYESFSVYAINYVVDSDEEYRWKTFAQELRDFYNNGRYRHDIDFIVKSRYSFPNPGLTSLVCNHIPMEEMKAAPSTGFLNFETLYLRGNSTYQVIDLAKTQYEMGRTFATFTPGGSTYTMGIHSRGCGLIEFSDKTTSFNYVNQINKMLYVHDTDLLPKDSTGQPKSANWYQIYNPDNREKIQIAIADLILDEMALETCFEGNRFFDLVCFSRFRGDNDQLAKRVAFRGGEEDAALRTFLQNDKNWYFKLPNR